MNEAAAPADLPGDRERRVWANTIRVLFLGYVSMTRSFAYLGIPQFKLFVGELALGTFLLTNFREMWQRWSSLVTRPSPLGWLVWSLVPFIGYGLFEVLRGIALGHPAFTAWRDLAFNYYTLYFLVGLWVGLREPEFIPRLIRQLAWCNGIYGVAWIYWLGALPWTIPGSPEVPVFSVPYGSAVASVGLIAFERAPARLWPPLLLNVFVLLGVSGRAEGLAYLLGLVIWAVLARQPKRILIGIAAVVIVLAGMQVSSFHVSAPHERGEVSAGDVLARAVAPFSRKLAARLSDRERASIYEGTAAWRLHWWREIWTSVHQTTERALLGHGYGFPLGDFMPGLKGTDLRTPHNVVFSALAFGGWIGVALFFLVQAALLSLLWQAYRLTYQPFGLAYWAMGFTLGSFGNFFETPFGAIPFYLLTGLAAVPALTESARAQAYSAGAPGLAAGRG